MRTVLGIHRNKLIVVAAVIAAVSLFAGCSRKKSAEQLPTQAQAEAEVTPPAEPNRITGLDVSPASIEQGQSAQLSATGTAGRSVAATLTAPGGATRQVNLSGTGGSYAGTLSGTESLAPGTYRLSAQMTGGGVDPANFTSDRTLTITQKAPSFAGCKALASELAGTTQVYFDFDQSALRADATSYIQGLAGRMRGIEGLDRLTIEGHCDERGTIEYNLALGGRRAKEVRAAFESAGVSVAIADISKGEESPVVRNASTEEDHQKNRRAVITLTCRQ